MSEQQNGNRANGDATDDNQADDSFPTDVTASDNPQLFALILILTVIAVPLILLVLVIINLSASIFACVVFEVLGHLLLRAYGAEGYKLRLLTSVKVGAVGGAIIAIPFNSLYALLERYVAPPVVTTSSEEDATQPLLPTQDESESDQRQNSSVHGAVRMVGSKLTDTVRNPFNQRLYARQQVQVTPVSRFKVYLALLGDAFAGPTMGALAGAIGSAVIGSTGETVLSVGHAAAAGALGGLVLGALAALVISSILACVVAIWASNRSL
ncbi:hypothetical protein CPB86DRAFT_496706 [Serendipita vermifera]|nr:hypothetical protein CPB86DRAFT_496706 [Serendipita vermifera]